jgi:rubrerythrin
MSIVSSGDELIRIAIDIERRGISFYDVIAKSTDNEMARATFEALVSMEREHLRLFQEMLIELGESPSRETGSREDNEYIQPEYIQSLIDEAVFSDDMVTSEMATQADSDIKAVEIGINAEKDSILFYYEMRDNVPGRIVPLVNRIIAEEKTHLQQLSEIKKKLAVA